jgi:hypothetical protein
MDFGILLVALVLQSSPAQQQPPPVDLRKSTPQASEYREPKKGETVIEGLLQRVECPAGKPIRFTLRAGNKVERFEAPKLDAVEFRAHTPEFKGPMTCGGRGKGDRVRLTWKKVGETRRVVAIEFLPAQ